jgi:hypothetical protein
MAPSLKSGTTGAAPIRAGLRWKLTRRGLCRVEPVASAVREGIQAGIIQWRAVAGRP